MKILFVGDIVGEPGRLVFGRLASLMKARGEVDMIIANAENAAAGSGITEKLAREIFAAGCDVMTLGDHVWDKRDVLPYLSSEERVVRPANFPAEAPGHGACVVTTACGVKVGVIALLGRTFMKYLTDCPFHALDREAQKMQAAGIKTVIVDMHAEATSEKVALGIYADGRVSAVLGTHTHIQTADEQILPGGTAYITDTGMTGPYDSVIGTQKELILQRYLTGLPNKFEVAKGPGTLCGVLLDIDDVTGKARSIVRVQKN
ncbi:MAG: TIGR00282 family metallophosphoesterase [Candidatus Omnitrophica bacterium]|nr:TIGR00282 family metallophosphoesterase [Candidatus Omnitrophota bacterium]